MVIFLNNILGSIDEKSQSKGDKKKIVSITERSQKALPKAFGVKNIELFLMRLKRDFYLLLL